MHTPKGRTALLGAVVLAAFVAVGGVIASVRTAPPDLDALELAVGTDAMVRAAEIPASDRAAARGVFLQLTSTGHFCLWDAPSAGSPQRQGGCNPAADPLGGRPLSISLAYEGGPAPTRVTDARLVGVAAKDVTSLSVEMSDGSHRRIALTPTSIGGIEYRAFGHRVRTSDLRRGLGPVAVVAFDAAGREIDRQATGFGG